MLLAAGLLGSVAQIFLTKAYQSGQAAMISASSYTTPVFNLIVGIFVFSTVPNTRGMIGAAIILVAGIALPFLNVRKRKVSRDDVPMEMTEK